MKEIDRYKMTTFTGTYADIKEKIVTLGRSNVKEKKKRFDFILTRYKLR